MPARILEGKPLATGIKQTLKSEIAALKRTLRVAAIHVGNDPAAELYMAMQKKACEGVGIEYAPQRFPDTVSEADLCQTIERFNEDAGVTGITIHLPLPKHVNTSNVLRTISPTKDIEATHPLNLGLLASGPHSPSPVAATGAVELLKSAVPSLKGLHVVVVGRSVMVGRPAALLLLHDKEAPTPTICHTGTKDLGAETRRADVIIAATGKAHLIRGTMIKPGAVVIDIGINELNGKVVGDVQFDEAKDVASMITPVPGGVGPVALAVFLRNILACARTVRLI